MMITLRGLALKSLNYDTCKGVIQPNKIEEEIWPDDKSSCTPDKSAKSSFNTTKSNKSGLICLGGAVVPLANRKIKGIAILNKSLDSITILNKSAITLNKTPKTVYVTSRERKMGLICLGGMILASHDYVSKNGTTVLNKVSGSISPISKTKDTVNIFSKGQQVINKISKGDEIVI